MLEYVTIQQAGELDAYVAHHKHGHFMQSSLWGRVKQDWPWIGIILRDCAGTIRGTIALLRHDSRLFPGCFFYAPRGPIFDNMAAFSELVDAAAEYSKTHGAYLLRIDPEIPETDAEMLALTQKKGFLLDQASDFTLFQPRLCYVSDLTGKDEHSLAMSFQWSTSVPESLKVVLAASRVSPDEAEDAGGLTPGKDDNEVWRNPAPQIMPFLGLTEH